MVKEEKVNEPQTPMEETPAKDPGNTPIEELVESLSDEELAEVFRRLSEEKN